MSWRLATSLKTLLSQVNAAYPDRAKQADGTIGDRKHRSRASRHNPNKDGVVTALDITHSPLRGPDAHLLAEALVMDPHPQLAYVISNKRIARRSTGFRWQRYWGTNPHKAHIHVAVGQGSDKAPRGPYDSDRAWAVLPASEIEDEMKLVEQIQKALNTATNSNLKVDGDWGPKTEAAFIKALRADGHSHEFTGTVKGRVK